MSSKVQVIKEIRDEFAAELGERPTKAQAEIIWQREVTAFEAMIEHVGMKPAAERCPRCAGYFRNWWVGADYPQGAELRQALKEIAAGRTTEVELAEAQLAEMQARESADAALVLIAAGEHPVVDEPAQPDEQVGWVVDGVVHTAPEELTPAQAAAGHDFCVDNRRSSTRLACSCGQTSRWSRDETRTMDAVVAHRSEVSLTV